MSTVDLNECPEFDALSYTWGNPYAEEPRFSYYHDFSEYIKVDGDYSPTNKYPISIDGYLLYITKNLYEGLLQLRSSLVLDATPTTKTEIRKPPFNKTPLILQAEKGRFENVKRLLQEGSDVGSEDIFGETALHYAAENGFYEVVRILVQAGADVHRRDGKNRTPLFVCFSYCLLTLFE